MDKLIMNINDYKSINKANIEINKINVVSGVNGSGKSTLSRILYSFLKANSTKRRDYLLERIVDRFNEIIELLDRGYVDYDFPEHFEVTDTIEEMVEKSNSLKEIANKIEKISESKEKKVEKEASEEFELLLEKLENEGLITIDEIKFKYNDLFIKYLELLKYIPTIDETEFTEFFKKFRELNSKYLYFFNIPLCVDFLSSASNIMEQFAGEDTYNVSLECFQAILLKEEGNSSYIKTPDFKMELSDYTSINAYEYFFNKGFIDNVYYFDNISILDLYLANNWDFKKLIVSHTDEFINELFESNDDKNHDDSIEFIIKKIENIIGGQYSSILPMFDTDKIDNSYVQFNSMNYKETVTTISDTPSGIKQMGIIQILLLNNKLKKGDYLIIDEPEVNLHPDWQFKFAEILVLLAKQFDVTIYINSHSPLFIESISAFSEFYDMPEGVNYYLTEPSEAEGKYDFVKITSDELYRLYDNLGNAYDLIDQLRLKKHLGE